MQCCACKRTHAFTLIELLIVVGIIAILALVALPNLLEAQVRSKISRARADMRTLATALETYAADNNKYVPRDDDDVVPESLTTPIAYLTSIPQDQFRPGNMSVRERRYGYHNVRAEVEALSPGWPENDLKRYGDWRFFSFGPKQESLPHVPYDSTNGTVSEGNVLRTQRSPEGKILFTFWDPANPQA
ncbi:MAG: type IV pilin protein [Candidatus Sumerlaeaceae bacterium]